MTVETKVWCKLHYIALCTCDCMISATVGAMIMHKNSFNIFIGKCCVSVSGTEEPVEEQERPKIPSDEGGLRQYSETSQVRR